MIKSNAVFFCVTDFCNAKCRSCSFWETKNPKFPKKEELPEIVDFIREKLGCGFLEVTGGEPLTYPFVYDLISLASKKGMMTQLMTNASLLDSRAIRRLEDAGLDMIAISVDHYDEKVMNDYRGIPGLPAKICRIIKELRKTDIITQAGIGITTYNVNDLEKTVEYALNLGFDEVYFCWPVKKTDSTYKIGNDRYGSTQISDEQMVDVLNRVIKIKKRFGHRISHKSVHLKESLRFYSGKKQEYTCKSGQSMFYLDNNLDVYRCMVLPEILGNVHKGVNVLKDAKCERCSMQCFREGSLYSSGLRSIPFFIDSILNRNYWKMRIIKKLRHILD
jgi:MoaA/NifB/PqqE/SkfB family radical SAM enzyme